MTGTGIIVVGGGVIGCLIARQIAVRAPGVPVTLLDADAVGSGASRRSAGLHLPRGATVRIRRMSAYSHDYYQNLSARDPSLPIRPVPAALVTPPDGEHLTGRYLPRAALEPVARLRDARVTLPAGAAAYRVHGAHVSDAGQLAQALAARARPRVAIAEGVAVTALHHDGDAVVVECGTRQRLVAARVVLAPGPWIAAPAWRDLVAPLGPRVKRIVALHIGLGPDVDDEAVLFDGDDAFLLPLAHRGHWLFSYSCREWDADPDAPATGLTARHLRDAAGCLARYSPALASQYQGGRVFCDAYSPDGEPVVRALDSAGRIIFAGAAGGSGYRLGPAIAAEAAELALAAEPAQAPELAAQSSEGVTGDSQQVRRAQPAPLLRD